MPFDRSLLEKLKTWEETGYERHKADHKSLKAFLARFTPTYTFPLWGTWEDRAKGPKAQSPPITEGEEKEGGG
jgi:hypothetical protein